MAPNSLRRLFLWLLRSRIRYQGLLSGLDCLLRKTRRVSWWALVRWLNADTLLGADDEMLREMRRDLGSGRAGPGPTPRFLRR